MKCLSPRSRAGESPRDQSDRVVLYQRVDLSRWRGEQVQARDQEKWDVHGEVHYGWEPFLARPVWCHEDCLRLLLQQFVLARNDGLRSFQSKLFRIVIPALIDDLATCCIPQAPLVLSSPDPPLKSFQCEFDRSPLVELKSSTNSSAFKIKS